MPLQMKTMAREHSQTNGAFLAFINRPRSSGPDVVLSCPCTRTSTRGCGSGNSTGSWYTNKRKYFDTQIYW